MIVCLNGKFLPDNQAFISIHDHGFLYGDGLYETIRVREGKPEFLTEHLRRFAQGRRRLGLSSRWSDAKLISFVRKTVRLNGFADAAVRITLTRGPGPHGLDPRPCLTLTLLIVARAVQDTSAVRARGGYVAAIVDVRRNSPRATPPEVKSISCLNGVLAKMESIALGADEALLTDDRGNVVEGAVSNVFAVKRGVVLTPRLDGGQLAGVTRAAVCRLVRRLGLRLSERVVKPSDLVRADEIFLTNALLRIMPVRALVWTVRGRRRRREFPAGPITARLCGAFEPRP